MSAISPLERYLLETEPYLLEKIEEDPTFERFVKKTKNSILSFELEYLESHIILNGINA